MNNEECCGNCKYHKSEPSSHGTEPVWYCDCEDSDFFGAYTDYSDGCEDYEGKE